MHHISFSYLYFQNGEKLQCVHTMNEFLPHDVTDFFTQVECLHLAPDFLQCHRMHCTLYCNCKYSLCVKGMGPDLYTLYHIY